MVTVAGESGVRDFTGAVMTVSGVNAGLDDFRDAAAAGVYKPEALLIMSTSSGYRTVAGIVVEDPNELISSMICLEAGATGVAVRPRA